MNELLEILRQNGHRLAKDAKTLLKTPSNVPSIDKRGGHYIYFSITSGILLDIALWCLCGITGSALDHILLLPVFEPRRGHI